MTGQGGSDLQVEFFVVLAVLVVHWCWSVISFAERAHGNR